MKTYARIINDTVVEIFQPLEGFDLYDSFPKDHADLFTEVEDTVLAGAVLKKGKWINPVAADPIPAIVVYPTISPTTFKLLFTIQEWFAVEDNIDTDRTLKYYWNLLTDTQTTVIDFNLKVVQDALNHLVSGGYITEDRKKEIMTGVVT